MAVKCGIVGLPNVGKSTLFNALTKAGIAAENFPFCTIEPNSGIVSIPDARLDKLAAIVDPQKTIPTTVEFTDIAGLVAGASKGEGLGNQFLANIRETDAIAHVVRCFEDSNVTHVSDQIDPTADIETINTELALSDLESVEKALDKVSRVANSGDKDAQRQTQLLEQVKAHLDEAKPVRTLNLSEEQLADIFLDELKPFIIAGRFSDWELPNDILQNHIINYYKDPHQPELIEKIIINLCLKDCPKSVLLELIQFAAENFLSTALLYLHTAVFDAKDEASCTHVILALLGLYRQAKETNPGSLEELR